MNSKSLWLEGTKTLNLDMPVYVPGGGTIHVRTLRDYLEPFDGRRSFAKDATELALRDLQERVEGNDAEQDQLQLRANRLKAGSRRHGELWNKIYRITDDTDDALERAIEYRAETLGALEAKAQIADRQLGEINDYSSTEKRLMKSLCQDVKKTLGKETA